MIQPLAVDPRVLRTLLPTDIKIVVGRALMARVVAAGAQGRGTLSIAGFAVQAQLPRDVRAGEDLRLVVRDVSAERVLLTISDDRPGSPAPATPAAPLPGLEPPIPLPGGASVQVAERDARPTGDPGTGEAHTLALRYQAPTIGAVDLRFALEPGSLRLTVSVAPGALALAQTQAQDLRAALSAQLGRAVSITIAARREPLDVYA